MTDISRRRVLQAAAVTIVTGGSVVREILAGGPAGASTGLRRTDFLPYVGKPFRLVAARVATVADLESIQDLAGAPPGAEGQFSAVFRYRSGEAERPQGVYRFRRKDFGAALLFAVPIHRPGATPRYQVVVNRPT